MRERIKLFDAHNGDIFLIVLATLFQQVVINLTRTHHHTLHAFRIEVIDFTDGRQEGAVRQLIQAGDRQRMAQQRFRRHHHQRTTHPAQRLTTQHVIHLSRSRRYAHLHVLLSAKLQITLQTRGGVLRTLPFITVRQQHHQATHPAPFLFARGDELVDNHLRAVGEVTELRFPDGQGARFRCGIAIFEGQYRFFRQHGVPDAEAALPVVDMLQRSPGRPVGLVVDHRVAMEEGAATGVFTGQANRDPFVNQRSVSQRFCAAPVERFFPVRH